jgi:cell division protein FtsL
MFVNTEAIIVVLLVLLFAILSLLPIVELRYNLNLNETIHDMNKYCSYNKNENGFYDLRIKNTFMWNMTNYLFDFERITNNFKKEGKYGTFGDIFKDIKNLNRDSSIVDGKFNIMEVYNKYLHYGIPLLILLWLYFTTHIIYIKFYCDTFERYEYSIYSTSYLFIYLALYTIFFLILLNKITKIYADTNCYKYIMLMKELDIIIKEQNPENTDILKELKAYNNNVTSIGDVTFDRNVLNNLINIHKKIDRKIK